MWCVSGKTPLHVPKLLRTLDWLGCDMFALERGANVCVLALPISGMVQHAEHHPHTHHKHTLVDDFHLLLLFLSRFSIFIVVIDGSELSYLFYLLI